MLKVCYFFIHFTEATFLPHSSESPIHLYSLVLNGGGGDADDGFSWCKGANGVKRCFVNYIKRSIYLQFLLNKRACKLWEHFFSCLIAYIFVYNVLRLTYGVTIPISNYILIILVKNDEFNVRNFLVKLNCGPVVQYRGTKLITPRDLP